MKDIQTYDDFQSNSSMKAEQSQTDKLCINTDLFCRRMPAIEDILKKELHIADCLVVPVGEVDGKTSDNFKLQYNYHIDVFAVFHTSQSEVCIIPIDLKYNYVKLQSNAVYANVDLWYHVNEYEHQCGIIGDVHAKYLNIEAAKAEILKLIQPGEEYYNLRKFINGHDIRFCDHMSLSVGIKGNKLIDGNYALYDTNAVYNVLANGLHTAIMQDPKVIAAIQNESDAPVDVNLKIGSKWYSVAFFRKDHKHKDRLANIKLKISRDPQFKYYHSVGY